MIKITKIVKPDQIVNLSKDEKYCKIVIKTHQNKTLKDNTLIRVHCYLKVRVAEIKGLRTILFKIIKDKELPEDILKNIHKLASHFAVNNNYWINKSEFEELYKYNIEYDLKLPLLKNYMIYINE